MCHVAFDDRIVLQDCEAKELAITVPFVVHGITGVLWSDVPQYIPTENDDSDQPSKTHFAGKCIFFFCYNAAPLVYKRVWSYHNPTQGLNSFGFRK